MERRNFLTKAATLGGGLVALKACGESQTGHADGGPAVQTKPKILWRLASSFPRSLDTIYGVAETFAKRVSGLTDGFFTIHPSPAGELVPALQVMDAVQQGTVSIGHTASYYFKGKNPALAFDCTVPFGMTARQQNAWMSFAGGRELMQKVFADFNMMSLPAGNTGTQMGGWFRREIGTLADLNGLKMRIPGFGGEVMSRMGVTVQVLGGPDIFPALERGAIDATEWVGPYDDEILGFHKIAKNYYYPGWWEPGPQLSLLINLKDWAKLPAQYQQAIEVAAAESNQTMLANYDAKNPPAMKRLLQAGVSFKPFAQDIMDAARSHTQEIIQEQVTADATYREIWTAWDQFRQDSSAWFGTCESAFSNFAFKS
ncbi:MAG: TRAP transporter substrate-binding protein [Acidobacteria bacterium]|nr:TRAP transporter substrate-binding protein [Acidobacteriota bacterium]